MYCGLLSKGDGEEECPSKRELFDTVRGPRMSQLSNASPLVPREDVAKHQYYSNENRNLLMQPVLERKLHHMVTLTKHFARWANQPIQEMLKDKWLSQGLLSTGYCTLPDQRMGIKGRGEASHPKIKHTHFSVPMPW